MTLPTIIKQDDIKNVSSRLIFPVEGAKLIRQALKGHGKFRVRASEGFVTIEWTDGQTEGSVAELLSGFNGKVFDGQLDMAVQKLSELDGRIVKFCFQLSLIRRYSPTVITKAISDYNTDFGFNLTQETLTYRDEKMIYGKLQEEVL